MAESILCGAHSGISGFCQSREPGGPRHLRPSHGTTTLWRAGWRGPVDTSDRQLGCLVSESDRRSSIAVMRIRVPERSPSGTFRVRSSHAGAQGSERTSLANSSSSRGSSIGSPTWTPGSPVRTIPATVHRYQGSPDQVGTGAAAEHGVRRAPFAGRPLFLEATTRRPGGGPGA
jgi:hypothetical protein